MTRGMIKTASLAAFLGFASMVSSPALAAEDLVFVFCKQDAEGELVVRETLASPSLVKPAEFEPGGNCFDAAALASEIGLIRDSNGILFGTLSHAAGKFLTSCGFGQSCRNSPDFGGPTLILVYTCREAGTCLDER